MKIFISYRRLDSQSITERITERLRQAFPYAKIFKDVDSVPPGVDFMEYATKRLSDADLVIPIIGDQWAKTLLARTDDNRDYLRMELEISIRENLWMLPVYVENAQPPTSHAIPESIHKIIEINGLQVRPDPDFSKDMLQLIATIDSRIGSKVPYIKKLYYKLLDSNLKYVMPLLFALAMIMYLLFGREKSIRQVCTNVRIATIVAQFEGDESNAFSNTLLTLLDAKLTDSLNTVSGVPVQSRSVKRYHDFIANNYFKESCDTSGLFINGFMHEEKEIFNFYATNVDLQLPHPDYLNERAIVLVSPDEIEFDAREDAEFIANFVVLLHSYSSEDPLIALEKNYRFQKDYNITEDGLKQHEDKSVLGPLYLMRGNLYAQGGNQEKANVYYSKSAKYGTQSIKETSTVNKVRAREIEALMIADPELKKVRALTIQKQKRIESQFEKFIKELANKVDKLFRRFK